MSSIERIETPTKQRRRHYGNRRRERELARYHLLAYLLTKLDEQSQTTMERWNRETSTVATARVVAARRLDECSLL